MNHLSKYVTGSDITTIKVIEKDEIKTVKSLSAEYVRKNPSITKTPFDCIVQVFDESTNDPIVCIVQLEAFKNENQEANAELLSSLILCLKSLESVREPMKNYQGMLAGKGFSLEGTRKCFATGLVEPYSSFKRNCEEDSVNDFISKSYSLLLKFESKTFYF